MEEEKLEDDDDGYLQYDLSYKSHDDPASLPMNLKLDLTYTENEPESAYCLSHRVRELNKELRKESSIPETSARKIKIKFHENLVTFISPYPPWSAYDVEEGDSELMEQGEDLHEISNDDEKSLESTISNNLSDTEITTPRSRSGNEIASEDKNINIKSHTEKEGVLISKNKMADENAVLSYETTENKDAEISAENFPPASNSDNAEKSSDLILLSETIGNEHENGSIIIPVSIENQNNASLSKQFVLNQNDENISTTSVKVSDNQSNSISVDFNAISNSDNSSSSTAPSSDTSEAEYNLLNDENLLASETKYELQKLDTSMKDENNLTPNENQQIEDHNITSGALTIEPVNSVSNKDASIVDASNQNLSAENRDVTDCSVDPPAKERSTSALSGTNGSSSHLSSSSSDKENNKEGKNSNKMQLKKSRYRPISDSLKGNNFVSSGSSSSESVSEVKATDKIEKDETMLEKKNVSLDNNTKPHSESKSTDEINDVKNNDTVSNISKSDNRPNSKYDSVSLSSIENDSKHRKQNNQRFKQRNDEARTEKIKSNNVRNTRKSTTTASLSSSNTDSFSLSSMDIKQDLVNHKTKNSETKSNTSNETLSSDLSLNLQKNNNEVKEGSVISTDHRDTNGYGDRYKTRENSVSTKHESKHESKLLRELTECSSSISSNRVSSISSGSSLNCKTQSSRNSKKKTLTTETSTKNTAQHWSRGWSKSSNADALTAWCQQKQIELLERRKSEKDQKMTEKLNELQEQALFKTWKTFNAQFIQHRQAQERNEDAESRNLQTLEWSSFYPTSKQSSDNSKTRHSTARSSSGRRKSPSKATENLNQKSVVGNGHMRRSSSEIINTRRNRELLSASSVRGSNENSKKVSHSSRTNLRSSSRGKKFEDSEVIDLENGSRLSSQDISGKNSETRNSLPDVNENARGRERRTDKRTNRRTDRSKESEAQRQYDEWLEEKQQHASQERQKQKQNREEANELRHSSNLMYKPTRNEWLSFKEWKRTKREQEREREELNFIHKKLISESHPRASQYERDVAFKMWLRRKRLQYQQEREKIRENIQFQLALARSLKKAQTLRKSFSRTPAVYSDYYGYRF